MKVAFIHYRLIHFGGLETRLRNYIHFFAERGDDVTVICAKYDKKLKLPKGVKVVKLSPGIMLKPFRAWYFNIRLGKWMKKNQYDFSLSLGRNSHQKLLLCPGTHKGFLRAFKTKKIRIGDWMQDYLDTIAYAKSEIILASSEKIRQELINLYKVNDKKIKILYPPFKKGNFKYADKNDRIKARQKLQLDEEKKYFLFVSTGHKTKNLKLLLDVFSELQNSDCRLLIVGSTVKSTIPSNVSYLGFQKELTPYYHAADFLLLPSIYESFGQVVLESLECGTPVIISENVGAGEILTKDTGLIIRGFDKNQWKEAILNINADGFNIPVNFAANIKLTLEEHMKRMLEYAGIGK